MRPSRPSTLLQRLALAGAGLAVATVLFAVGGGLVAFGLWPGELSPDATKRMVLRTPTPEPAAAGRPRSIAVARPVAVSRPRPAPLPAAAGPVIAPPAAALTITPAEPPPRLPIPEIPDVPEPIEPGPPPALPVAPPIAVAPVVEVAGETTSTLARTLGGVATTLDQGLAAVGDLLDGPGP